MINDIRKQYENNTHQCTVDLGGARSEYPSEAVDTLLKAGNDLSAIYGFDMQVGNPVIGISHRRGIGGTNQNIDVPDRQASPYFDEIGINVTASGKAASPEQIIAVRRVLGKHTQLPSDSTVVGAASEATDLLKLQFSQLNEQLAEINTHNIKRREALEDEFSDKRRLLEKELANHAEQLREKMEQLDADHRTRVEAVQAREKQLDDRDHIHARRELRTNITEDIARQLQGDLIPAKASAMRWSVLMLLLIGTIGMGGLAAWSLFEFGQLTYLASLKETLSSEQLQERTYATAQIEAGFHWLVLARGFVAGVVAIGFLLYAISWLKALYHEEVKTRRDLQRYSTDLSRASWAIESIMEAKSSDGVAIPEAVIAGITRNLFETPGDSKSNKETSANALAELLRTSGKAKFGPDGATFELNSRGANRLAEKIDD
ncbi:hypothetical protein ACFWXH_10520 [Mesorhizobium sp. NPDC059054]|uniref:hypothetical protein n=1 Tax=Mesorhizobium sp. NPDC059054 TaxID=3346711 RepID=UPI0036D051F2